MAIRYVDVTLSGTVTTYDPSAEAGSRHVGGTELGYSNLKDAQTPMANSDTIIFREGDDVINSQPFFAEDDITFLVAEGERYTCDISLGTSYTLVLAGDNNVIDARGGYIEFINSLAAGNRAPINLSGDNFVSYNMALSGKTYWMVILPSGAGYTYTMHNPIFKSDYKVNVGERAGQFSNTNIPTLILNNPVFEGTCWQNVVTEVDLTMNNPTFLPSTINPALDVHTAVTAWTINNPIIIGGAFDVTTAPSIKAVNNVVTVNGGVVHENLGSPFLNPLEGVTGTFNQDKVVKFERGAPKAYVSICTYDSGAFTLDKGVDGSIMDYIDEADARGVKLSSFTDDHYTAFHVATMAKVREYIERGHDFGMAHQSGGDPLYQEQPEQVTYSGTGVATLTISDNGEVWTLTDTDDISAPYTFDASKGGAEQFHGSYVPTNMMGKIAALPNFGGSGYNIVTGGYDDAPSRSFDDAVYALPIGVPVPLQLNMERHLYLEVTEPKAFLEEKISAMLRYQYKIKSFYINGGQTTNLIDSVLLDNDFTSAFGGSDNLKTKVSTMNPMFVGKGFFTTGADAALIETLAAFNLLADDAAREARLKQTIASLASYLFLYGGFVPITINHASGFRWSPKYVGMLIDALQNAGVTIVPHSELESLAGSNEPVGGDSYAQAADSEGVGQGVRYWSGANPVGLDGEPFSDVHPDCGSTQSVNDDRHPANL